MSYRKHGGLRFVRIGRLQISWSICKRKPRHRWYHEYADLWISANPYDGINQ